MLLASACYTHVMSVKITYFVHGTTTDNEQGLATGQQPGELSELGRRQAELLGHQVADQQFDVVFSSDLKRAVESAELGFGSTYEILQDKRLRECDYGDLTGYPTEEVDDNIENVDKPFPNGESIRDVERRIAEFCEFVKQNYDGKHVAIVDHKWPQLALEVLLNGKTWQQAIAEDWRKTKSWQPGWEYVIS